MKPAIGVERRSGSRRLGARDPMDAESLRARQAEWDRFHQWERAHLAEQTLEEKWRWYEAAYELARQLGHLCRASPRP